MLLNPAKLDRNPNTEINAFNIHPMLLFIGLGGRYKLESKFLKYSSIRVSPDLTWKSDPIPDNMMRIITIMRCSQFFIISSMMIHSEMHQMEIHVSISLPLYMGTRSLTCMGSRSKELPLIIKERLSPPPFHIRSKERSP